MLLILCRPTTAAHGDYGVFGGCCVPCCVPVSRYVPMSPQWRQCIARGWNTSRVGHWPFLRFGTFGYESVLEAIRGDVPRPISSILSCRCCLKPPELPWCGHNLPALHASAGSEMILQNNANWETQVLWLYRCATCRIPTNQPCSAVK